MSIQIESGGPVAHRIDCRFFLRDDRDTRGGEEAYSLFDTLKSRRLAVFAGSLEWAISQCDAAIDENTEIVVHAVVARCGHNRVLRGYELMSGPRYVTAHFDDGFDLVDSLLTLGHEVTVCPRYEDVSMMEIADFMGDESDRKGY